MNVSAPSKLAFPSGFGQSDTHAKILSNGRPNPHRAAGSPYGTITARNIATLVDEPQAVTKEDARWFLPSTYAEHDARNHAVQREHGAYWWLVLDADKNDLDISDIEGALEAIAAGATRLIYSTRSSKPGDRRWRALLPLSAPISGTDYTDTAMAFYRMLEDASGGILIADEKVGGCGQLVYLPNRGEHYEARVQRGHRLVLDSDHPIIRRRENERQRIEKVKEAAAAERQRRRETRQKVYGDEEQPIDHFNAAHSVAELLDRYGYDQLGGSTNWRSPLQTSQTYATRDFGDFWVSLSGSDATADIGAETKTGARFGDAFDLYVHFEHGGNLKIAVSTYSKEAGLNHQFRNGTSAPVIDTNCLSNPPGHNAPDAFDLSHDALAIDLGKQAWDENAKYVAAWGKWVLWDGTRWAIDERLEHMTRARTYLRNRADDVAGWAERKAPEIEDKEGDDKAAKLRNWAKSQVMALRSKTTVAAVETMARSNPASVTGANDFDGDLMILGTPGGTVDLRTGELRAARRADMITKMAAVTPAPQGTPAPLWMRFLADVFEGDEEIINFMQRATGYALTGLTIEHKLLFLYGTGRNGKSTFLDTLQWLWADYARRSAASTFLNSTTERHPTDIAGLKGARLVVGSELPKGKTWDESVIKDLTGGDRLTARFMRGDFFDFDPQLTLMIAGNNMPSFRGVDEAIRARVVLVPFTVTIPAEKRDKDLPVKLKAEAPAILRWAIDGALEWQQRGLDVPKSITAASNEYFDSEDTVGQFLCDQTDKVTGHFTSAADLYQRFSQWADGQGLHGWTQRTLIKELKGRGFIDGKGTGGVRGVKGLKLN